MPRSSSCDKSSENTSITAVLQGGSRDGVAEMLTCPQQAGDETLIQGGQARAGGVRLDSEDQQLSPGPSPPASSRTTREETEAQSIGNSSCLLGSL